MDSQVSYNRKSKNKWQSQQISKKFKKKHVSKTTIEENKIDIACNNLDTNYPLNQFTDSTKYYSWIIIEGKYPQRAHLGIPKDISRLQAFATNKNNINHRLSSVLKQPTALQINNAISKVLKEFTEMNTIENHCIMIAFTGHGDKNGDWYLCKNNCLSLNYILESIAMRNNYNVNLMILSTACCSGNWCYDLEKIMKKKNNIHSKYDINCINDITIIAASEKNEFEYQIQRNPNDGSRFYRFLFGIGKYENHSGLNMCFICKNVKNKKYKCNEHKEYYHNQYCFLYKEYKIVVYQNGYNQLYQWNQDGNTFEIYSSYHVNENKKRRKRNVKSKCKLI